MLLAVAGIGIGTIFPVTTVAIQNAVEPHQLGTATATFNFFRSLGSAILVAVFGTIFLGGLGVGGQAIGSLERLVAIAAAERHADRAGLHADLRRRRDDRWPIGLACFLAMEERPLKGRAGGVNRRRGRCRHTISR